MKSKKVRQFKVYLTPETYGLVQRLIPVGQRSRWVEDAIIEKIKKHGKT